MNQLTPIRLPKSYLGGLVIATGVAAGAYLIFSYKIDGYTWSCDNITEQSKLASCQAFVSGVPQQVEIAKIGMLLGIPIIWILGLFVVPRYSNMEGQI